MPSGEYLAVRPLCGRNNIASSLKWVKAVAAMLSPFSRAWHGLQLISSVFRVKLMTGFRYLRVPEIVHRGKMNRHANTGSRGVNQSSDRGGAAHGRLLGNILASLSH